MAFAIKARIDDPQAGTFTFTAQKTMYGGKHIAAGDAVFVFASETDGGRGLVARGVVISAHPEPRTAGLERQTPRVSVTVKRTGLATRPLGRREIKGQTDWANGDPAAELNFKLYRQATNKIIGLSDRAAGFLESFFQAPEPSDTPAVM